MQTTDSRAWYAALKAKDARFDGRFFVGVSSTLGVKKALAPLSEKEILETAEAWRPWRGYATINLWNSFQE